MQFIPETVIEEVVALLERDPGAYDRLSERMGKEQPYLLSYLFSDDFDLLTARERELMLYVVLVIWQSAARLHPGLQRLAERHLGDAEEANWQVLSEVKATRFRERMDVFFRDYPQEDLLAFVEDMLVENDEAPEEEHLVTREGREPLFVALKAVIDAFDRANPS